MTPCGHSNRTVPRYTQRRLHGTGAESIFSGFGLKNAASLLPGSESHGLFGVVHPRSQGLWKNLPQCGQFKTVSTASMARNSTRTAACLCKGCSPKIAGGNQKQ